MSGQRTGHQERELVTPVHSPDAGRGNDEIAEAAASRIAFWIFTLLVSASAAQGYRRPQASNVLHNDSSGARMDRR